MESIGKLGKLAGLLKQAGKLKEKMAALQTELAEKTVEATSGAGLVTVTVNGVQEVVSIEIDDEIVGSGDKEMLQDLVTSAVNAALERSREMAGQEVSKITGGLDLGIAGLT